MNLETFSPEITLKEPEATEEMQEISKTVHRQERVQELALSLGMFQLVLLGQNLQRTVERSMYSSLKIVRA